jgi:hypothetical protein
LTSVRRWIMADPSTIVDGLNLYRYTHNSPIDYIDISGNKTIPFEGFTGNETMEELERFAFSHGIKITDPKFTVDEYKKQFRPGREGNGGRWKFDFEPIEFYSPSDGPQYGFGTSGVSISDMHPPPTIPSRGYDTSFGTKKGGDGKRIDGPDEGETGGDTNDPKKASTLLDAVTAIANIFNFEKPHHDGGASGGVTGGRSKDGYKGTLFQILAIVGSIFIGKIASKFGKFVSGLKKEGEIFLRKFFGKVEEKAEAKAAAEGLNLSKKLASESQIAEQEGRLIAGKGADEEFRNAEQIAREYGGKAEDWVKKSSSKYYSKDGYLFETHWIENLITGQRIEFKTKFPNGIIQRFSKN